MVTKTLDERVADLEAIYVDLPEIMSLRFGSVRSQIEELSSRVGLLEKGLSILMRDVRDLRGGVTRQLMAQDQRLAALEQRLDRTIEGFERLTTIVTGLAEGVAQRFSALESKVDANHADVLTRLAAVHAKIDANQAELLARLPRA